MPLEHRDGKVFLDHFLYSSFTHATSFLRVSKARQVSDQALNLTDLALARLTLRGLFNRRMME